MIYVSALKVPPSCEESASVICGMYLCVVIVHTPGSLLGMSQTHPDWSLANFLYFIKCFEANYCILSAVLGPHHLEMHDISEQQFSYSGNWKEEGNILLSYS